MQYQYDETANDALLFPSHDFVFTFYNVKGGQTTDCKQISKLLHDHSFNKTARKAQYEEIN